MSKKTGDDHIDTVSDWLGLLPSGAREAQNEILHRYRDQVVDYARYRLVQLGVRGKEADDIAQGVFMGLFKRAGEGKLPEMNNRDQLWLKLRRITGDRVKDARRKKLPFTESAIDVGEGSDVAPAMARVADEQLDESLLMVEHALVRRILTRRHRELPEIASMKMQGFAVQEIADRLGVPKRTVERRLQWIDEICDEYATM